MLSAKLCITVALALGGWHAALASALCARHADCHAAASSPRPSHAGHHSRPTSDQTHGNAAARAADVRHQAAAPAAVDPAGDLASRHGHCGTAAEAPHGVGRAALTDDETGVAHGGGENVSPETAAHPRAPAPSCEHCVGRQTPQPARAKSVAPDSPRDSRAAPVAAPHLVALPTLRPRPRLSPTEHSPPRGRPVHLLNSVLLI